VLYVCENQRDYWRDRGLRAATDGVVHNGIDVGHFTDRQSPADRLALRTELGFAPQDYVIGLCSSLRPEKAHGDLLQAIGQLRSRGVAAKALFIGDGPERATVRERGSRPWTPRTRGHHGTPGGRTPVHRLLDVMTLVSHAIETFSLAALESMALASPWSERYRELGAGSARADRPAV